jgi:hypothetical protein
MMGTAYSSGSSKLGMFEGHRDLDLDLQLELELYLGNPIPSTELR